jgi:predicted TIM-barrel fold metal-dependent hydrolase
VLVLTPSGNATERHVCLAYARKAREAFEDDDALSKFWVEKLGREAESVELPEGIDLLNMIRAKTMKRGGAGYVVPDKGSFPLMADFNRFVLAAGGIPTMTWLNGLSEGEQALEELVEVAMSAGTVAINFIPDRDYTPGVKDQKLENLYQVVELAEELGLPVVVGTEMNSPGQKFVDDFDSQELSPVSGVFLEGAYIVYAHSVLQQAAGLGYTSEWAENNFGSVAEKNEFFERLGRSLEVENEGVLGDLSEDATTQQILEKIGN